MAEQSTPAPEITPEQKAARRKAAIKAWHDADTGEKQKAAVKDFPELAQIFSLAHSIQSKL